MMEDQNQNHVAIQIKAILEKAKPLFTTECCIYRVPHEIRKLNKDAYTPKVVSIGPFHHGSTRLQNMENQKQLYCQKFTEKRAQTSLDKLVSCVQESEAEVRQCYSENIKLSPEKFVEVILIDCCFIFEFFLRYFYDQWTHDDATTLKPWLTSSIRLDLLLLENQLPFSVLEKLYDVAFASRLKDNHHPSFKKLSFHYFDTYNKLKLPPTVGIKHFTDLLRTFHLQPSNRRPERQVETVNHLKSATELIEAGVKFKVNRESQCLLDLQFSGRCLEIPEVKVEDWTEILFRNMVALEQCYYPDESYVTDFVAMLHFLINTSKDVDVLVQKGIIVNWLGDSNAVAKQLNGLWKNITQLRFNSKYLVICRKLNKYCKHPWHSKRATLKRDYCKTPWRTVASIAAILLLILTIIQTVCSILQVVLPV